MTAPTLVFTLQDLHHGSWKAVLGDGVQEATLIASYTLSDPLLSLLTAVRSLLMGTTTEAKCSWWEEPGEYRWLFLRQNEQVQIHIAWFDGSSWRSDEQGKTILKMECNLLKFAKRLFHQLGQLSYQEKSPAVPPLDYQHFQEAMRACEHAKPEKQT